MTRSDLEKHTTINRRQALLLPATAGLGAALAGRAKASDSTKTATHQEAGTCSTPRSAIANTQYGKVRGFVSGGVLTFKGIPYGQNTGGENRWLPAKAPKPWTDEYPALIYGPNSPQRLHTWSLEQSFIQDWDDGYQGEDMLKLNVWTPSLTGKRPVLVYYHGGGWDFGSSYELPSHEGAQLARNHDAVSVTVNHRLNVLGLLDISEIGGAAYADSANASLMDLVASLRWVRENIANFGGDPDKVMIYGQSGGGAKIAALLATPPAAGLFHRASIQSPGPGNHPEPALSRELARQFMKDLGLAANDLASLQKMEWAKLMAAYGTAAVKVNGGPGRHSLGPASNAAGPPRAGGGPTVDGRIMTMRSLWDGAPEISKNIPIMIGTVSEEGNAMASRPTEEQWHANLTQIIGDAKATALIAAMKKAHPEKSIRTLSYGVTALDWANYVCKMAKLKYEQHGAPVYRYYFTWQSPMLEDAGAWHTQDLTFCFDNAKRCEQGTGNTPEAQALGKKMATAWVNFARTGNPSQPGLTWTPWEPDRCPTMVWDNQCRMVNDPDGDVRRILES
jgi:para-nitrobenzyl esterase